jgi:hypothetical protein
MDKLQADAIEFLSHVPEKLHVIDTDYRRASKLYGRSAS